GFGELDLRRLPWPDARGLEHFLKQGAFLFRYRINNQVLVGKIFGPDVSAASKPVIGGGYGNQLISKQRLIAQPRVVGLLGYERHIELAGYERFDGMPRGVDHDLHFNLRKRAIEFRQHRREPVITGVTFSADANLARV